MPTEKFANNAQTTLNGAISDSVSSLSVASASGFPTAAQYRIRIDNEILIVTSGAGSTTWTVVRGAEATTPAAHADAATVTHILTAGAVAKLKAEIFKAVSLRS